MQTKHFALLLAAAFLAMLTSFMLFQARAMLPTISRIYILIACAILALAALVVLAWLVKNLHRHWHDMLQASHSHKERKYELTERAQRWELERQERLAALHLQMSRVQPGTYLIRPETHIRPSEQDIILLPGAPSRAAAGSMIDQRAASLTEPGELPTQVLYEQVRGQVPAGHILVGIGRQGIETKSRAVGACVWIVGLSGTGKTSTTVLRVEERAADDHAFLGVDPHWFKDDSLYHAIYETLDGQPGAYADRFAHPMAKNPGEAKRVLQAFLNEFNARKAGQIAKPWRRITLLVDEVNALMDATTPEEKEIADMLPSIARICGQEARNFEMGGIFISQQATGLAWLRKVALMVIVHQLLMESEKLLAVNYDKRAVEEMKTWPVGRTYVYGVGFQEGPRTVQQPYFKPAGVIGEYEMEALQPAHKPFLLTAYQEQEDIPDEEDFIDEEDDGPNTDGLPIDEDLREALDAWRSGATGVRPLQRELNITYYRANQLYQALKENGLIEVD